MGPCTCAPRRDSRAPGPRPRAHLRRLRSLRAFLKLLESRIVQPLLAREQLLEPWPFRGCNTPHQLLLDLHRPRERMADERTGIVYTLAHVVVQFGPQPSRAEPRAKGRDRDVLVNGSIEPPVCDDIRLCERSRGPSLDAAAGAGGHARVRVWPDSPRTPYSCAARCCTQRVPLRRAASFGERRCACSSPARPPPRSARGEPPSTC